MLRIRVRKRVIDRSFGIQTNRLCRQMRPFGSWPCEKAHSLGAFHFIIRPYLIYSFDFEFYMFRI